MGIKTKKERIKFHSTTIREDSFDEIERRRRDLEDFYRKTRKKHWRVSKNDIIEDALKRSGHPLEIIGGKK